MRNILAQLCFIMVFVFCSSCQLKGQVYIDFFLGIHPQLVDEESFTAHLNLAAGRQASEKLGYGLNVGAMATITTSTSSSFSMMGVQYRILDNNHRFYGKVEVGSLLNAAYSTDGPFEFTYDNNFDPYYRIYWGYRFGRATMGMNYTYISSFSENIAAYDENLDRYVPTGQVRMRDFHDVQIFFGFSLDAYPVTRRKKIKNQ